MAPFNSEARHEIKKRSGNKSELDGKEYLPSMLKCGHLNHDKDHPDYNNPDNGMRVTIWQECAYHMIHQPRPEDIGLSNENNRRAVQCNMQDLIDLGYSYDEVRELVGEAIGLWLEYLGDDMEPSGASICNETEKEVQTPAVKFVGFENGEYKFDFIRDE